MQARVAPLMLSASTSAAGAKVTETASARAQISSYSVSRRIAREFFRIVQPLRQIVAVENDRRDADRAGQRAAPDLVDAGDGPEPLREQLGLDFEVGAHRAWFRQRMFQAAQVAPGLRLFQRRAQR